MLLAFAGWRMTVPRVVGRSGTDSFGLLTLSKSSWFFLWTTVALAAIPSISEREGGRGRGVKGSALRVRTYKEYYFDQNCAKSHLLNFLRTGPCG